MLFTFAQYVFKMFVNYVRLCICTIFLLLRERYVTLLCTFKIYVNALFLEEILNKCVL